MESQELSEDSIELYAKGFRLANFLLRDRTDAIQTVASALNKLAARCKRESRRAFWRDKYLKRRTTKISREDGDTLQWLIYCESEPFEKGNEERGGGSASDFIIWFIKSVVQITAGTSSFYVAIGMHRLIHSYSTAEIQQVYELVTERYLGADEYRRAKRFLMNQLRRRFGERLKTVTIAHGEQRFELQPDQQRWAGLVLDCLRQFVPWSTEGKCGVPEGFTVGGMLPPVLTGCGQSGAAMDKVETHRSHAFIDQVCFGRLARALGLQEPERRLALPEFYMQMRDDDDPRVPPADLLPHEHRMIQSHLDSEAGRRQRASCRMLRIVVEGHELAQFNPGTKRNVSVQLEEGARLIELWTDDDEGDLLLGTYIVNYDDRHQVSPSAAEISLANGLRINIDVSARDGDGTFCGLVTVSCEGSVRPISVSPFMPGLRPIVVYAITVFVFVGLGFFAEREMYRNALKREQARNAVLRDQLSAAEKDTQVRGESSHRTADVIAKLTPYDLSTRGSNSMELITVTVQPHAVVTLELSLANAERTSYRATLRPFPGGDEVLRETVSVSGGKEASVVRMSIPSDVLRDSQQYMVELAAPGTKGRDVEDTYMFQAKQGRVIP